MPLVRLTQSELLWQVDAEIDCVVLQAHARRFVRRLGLGEPYCSRIVIALSEIATNIIKHGVRGRVLVVHLMQPSEGVLIEGTDDGPGFADIESSLRDHFSEGRNLLDPERFARFHRGLGTGLGAVRRLMGDLTVDNLPRGGARVRAFVPTKRD